MNGVLAPTHDPGSPTPPPQGPPPLPVGASLTYRGPASPSQVLSGLTLSPPRPQPPSPLSSPSQAGFLKELSLPFSPHSLLTPPPSDPPASSSPAPNSPCPCGPALPLLGKAPPQIPLCPPGRPSLPPGAGSGLISSLRMFLLRFVFQLSPIPSPRPPHLPPAATTHSPEPHEPHALCSV